MVDRPIKYILLALLHVQVTFFWLCNKVTWLPTSLHQALMGLSAAYTIV